MTKRQWSITKKSEILSTVPFKVEELEINNGTKALDHPYYRLNCPDWVNVLPVTSDGQIILIKQFRVGTEGDVLELPGGIVDPHEINDPTMAAARELEEETGFTSQRILPLLSVNPNPAIQNNKVHLFVALNCEIALDRNHHPDENEDISVKAVNKKDLDHLVRTGQINHSLSCLSIMLAEKYLR